MFRRVLNRIMNYGSSSTLLNNDSRITSSNHFQGFVPSRSTFILKRRYPVKLGKKGRTDPPRLKGRHYVYDLVENTETKKKPEVEVVLTRYVEGFGNAGDCVTVSQNEAYYKLLLPGLADYATEESLERARKKKEMQETNEEVFSSRTSPKTLKFLQNHVLSILMNKDIEWVLQPWHVRVAFRKYGIHVPDSCIELPEKEIRGPDMNLHQKEFLVTVTINNQEKASVRSRIYHWSTNPGDRIPHTKFYWTLPCEPIFSEQQPQLASLPLPKAPEIKEL